MNNYELVLQKLVGKLARFNYAIISCRTGADFDVDTDTLKVPFFGKDYIVTKESCYAADGRDDGDKDKILIIDYLLSFGSPETGDEWIDFREVHNSMPYDGAFRANVESVLELHAAEVIRNKDALMTRFNGYEIRGFDSADLVAAFQVFPRMECLVLLSEGDDEIGSGAKVLFSSHAPNFLSTESLAAIAESLTRRLVS